MTQIRPRRSLLFAPGNRPAIHAKALASGADVVCVDLEDAVPLADKATARAETVPFLNGGEGPERVVRINSLRSVEGLRDLLAIIEARPSGGVIFLPKVATADEVRIADDLLTEAGLDLQLAALIESAEGLRNAADIFRASPRVVFGMFGGVDYAADVGLTLAYEPMLHARSTLVHAAALSRVDLFDVPCLSFRDESIVRSETEAAQALGFTGKAALHPNNVATINSVLSPSPEDVARAEIIVQLYDDSPNGLAEHDGKLIEIPVVRAMRRVLATRDALFTS